MQLGIAAGQPADIATVRRRFILQRRERHDLGAGPPPAIEHMGVDKGERVIQRARCAARAAAAARASPPHRPRAAKPWRGCRRDRDDVPPLRRNDQPRREVSMLAGLDQAEMALRQQQRLVARDGAEDRDAERLQRIRDQRAWRSLPSLLSTTPPTRTDGLYEAKPAATRPPTATVPRRRDEQHRQIQPRREIGGRAGAPAPGTPSNSPIAPSITSSSASLAVSAISASIRARASPRCRG